MLKSLNIENIAVIEKTSIEFSNGFNVLTGETGSGKSILVDSLGAVLGSRTSKNLVRTGADSALVIAQFCDFDKSVSEKLEELDLSDDDDSLIIQRRISADGKSSCRINGKPVTASVIKEVASLLVNIHGQRDNGELLNSDNHYKYIDSLMGDDKLISEYKAAYKKLCSTIRALREIDNDDEQKEKLIEKLSAQVKEIEEAQVVVGEREKLTARKEIINNCADVINALQESVRAISGDDEFQGAQSLLQSAASSLGTFSDMEGMGEIYEKVQEYSFLLGELASSMNEKIEQYDIDPMQIYGIEDRLAELYALSSKYGNTEEDILEYLKECKLRIENIKYSEQRRTQLEEEFEQRREKAYNLALKLSQKRRKTASKLEKEIERELEFLNMPGARFSVSIQNGPMCSTGIDKIEFMISLNAGEALKPLAGVASGGELSRIMLAIKSVMGEKDTVDTLIFDEIDSGVSGRAAEKIGFKLKEISDSAQVICRTHLAQIACMADSHYLIEKNAVNDRTYTNVSLLDEKGRTAELARIMGGSNISEEMLKSARQMLKLESK